MRRFEVDEQDADAGVAADVAHRIEHAVAVVAGEGDGAFVHDFYEAGIAALVGTGRKAAGVDCRQEEHVAALDEGLLVVRHFRMDDELFGGIRDAPGVEHVLECALRRGVKLAHFCSRFMSR